MRDFVGVVLGLYSPSNTNQMISNMVITVPR